MISLQINGNSSCSKVIYHIQDQALEELHTSKGCFSLEGIRRKVGTTTEICSIMIYWEKGGIM